MRGLYYVSVTLLYIIIGHSGWNPSHGQITMADMHAIHICFERVLHAQVIECSQIKPDERHAAVYLHH